jgi:hypothetical protein
MVVCTLRALGAEPMPAIPKPTPEQVAWQDAEAGMMICLDLIPILKKHQPKSMVFQGPAATIRWIGNERGVAGYPCWATVQASEAAGDGDPKGAIWQPAECDAPTAIDHVMLIVQIAEVARLREYVIEGMADGQWTPICRGQSIGHKRIAVPAPGRVKGPIPVPTIDRGTPDPQARRIPRRRQILKAADPVFSPGKRFFGCLRIWVVCGRYPPENRSEIGRKMTGNGPKMPENVSFLLIFAGFFRRVFVHKSFWHKGVCCTVVVE